MIQHEIGRLSAVLKEFQGEPSPISPLKDAPPAVRIIECVLSLRAKFFAVVVPRVTRFAVTYPDVASSLDLSEAIQGAGGPHSFMKTCLNYNSEKRGHTLYGVANYLHAQQQRFSGNTEISRLEVWAKSAAPDGHRQAGVRGFGLAGFQYMRMLFGADTTKPDVHVVTYIANALDRAVTPHEAWRLLEAVGTQTGIAVRQYDAFIWTKQQKASAARRRTCRIVSTTLPLPHSHATAPVNGAGLPRASPGKKQNRYIHK